MISAKVGRIIKQGIFMIRNLLLDNLNKKGGETDG